MDDHSLPSLPTSSPREELLYLFSLGVIRHQRRTTENNQPDTVTGWTSSVTRACMSPSQPEETTREKE
ncbi:hypothetical protein [Sansalvadorimonas verongulae]|uniref:hypothetical protein n=1 Tax=Sansalvadorimonas verongulae TaxID=2172824 RepID=UPI0012BB9045|nr:hypothetical protein [Sansalvadorimonas verongulae]MTI12705.1 hypothetical protein [Sansalvadorimonas verongulae]